VGRDEAFSEIHRTQRCRSLGVASDAPLAISQSLLLPIAERLAKFAGEEDFAKLKACEDITAR
jgi:hypothetical protein